MTDKEYRYLVAYNFKDGYETGSGNMYTTASELTQDKIRSIVSWIKEEEKFDHVVILNIIKLNEVREG